MRLSSSLSLPSASQVMLSIGDVASDAICFSGLKSIREGKRMMFKKYSGLLPIHLRCDEFLSDTFHTCDLSAALILREQHYAYDSAHLQKDTMSDNPMEFFDPVVRA